MNKSICDLNLLVRLYAGSYRALKQMGTMVFPVSV